MEIIKEAQKNPEIETASLYSILESGPFYKYLKNLSLQEQLIGQEQLEQEFRAIIDKLNTQSKQIRLDELYKKEFSSLSAGEKEELKNLSTDKSLN